MSTLIRVVDFEMTGLPTDEGGAALCEVACCDVSVVNALASVASGALDMLVNPARPIPVIARAIHHIGDADVQGALSQQAALQNLTAEKPAGGELIYAAHNADFERAFFKPDASWICTYKVALRLWPDAPAHSNQVLRYFLNLDLPASQCLPAHRAGPDAFVTAHLLAHAINSGRTSLDDMVRWSNGPALFPRVPLGKHRGAAWPDVPSDYLNWIVAKSDLDRDIKANARHHLKLRAAA